MHRLPGDQSDLRLHDLLLIAFTQPAERLQIERGGVGGDERRSVIGEQSVDLLFIHPRRASHLQLHLLLVGQ